MVVPDDRPDHQVREDVEREGVVLAGRIEAVAEAEGLLEGDAIGAAGLRAACVRRLRLGGGERDHRVVLRVRRPPSSRRRCGFCGSRFDSLPLRGFRPGAPAPPSSQVEPAPGPMRTAVPREAIRTGRKLPLAVREAQGRIDSCSTSGTKLSPARYIFVARLSLSTTGGANVRAVDERAPRSHGRGQGTEELFLRDADRLLQLQLLLRRTDEPGRGDRTARPRPGLCWLPGTAWSRTATGSSSSMGAPSSSSKAGPCGPCSRHFFRCSTALERWMRSSPGSERLPRSVRPCVPRSSSRSISSTRMVCSAKGRRRRPGRHCWPARSQRCTDSPRRRRSSVCGSLRWRSSAIPRPARRSRGFSVRPVSVPFTREGGRRGRSRSCGRGTVCARVAGGRELEQAGAGTRNPLAWSEAVRRGRCQRRPSGRARRVRLLRILLIGLRPTSNTAGISSGSSPRLRQRASWRVCRDRGGRCVATRSRLGDRPRYHASGSSSCPRAPACAVGCRAPPSFGFPVARPARRPNASRHRFRGTKPTRRQRDRRALAGPSACRLPLHRDRHPRSRSALPRPASRGSSRPRARSARATRSSEARSST